MGIVINLSQFPPSKSTAALSPLMRCTNPLYPLYIDWESTTTTVEPGKIGLLERVTDKIYLKVY